MLAVSGCSDDSPTSPRDGTRSASGASVSALAFGPFPGGTTIFVDATNTSGVENGSRAHPYRTLRKGLEAAVSGSVVGVAPGLYADEYPTGLTLQYQIDGLKNFKLLGSGPQRTTIRGNHGFALIWVSNGASALIKGFTIEEGGDPGHSVAGGIQVFGRDPISLTVQNVVLRRNTAVNGGGIAAEGTAVQLRLVNVVVSDNVGNNGPGGIYLLGVPGRVTATLVNTTVTHNHGSFFSGGIGIEGDVRLRLLNSIVWDNALAEIAKGPSGQSIITVSHSDVGEHLYPGEGNLSVNPRFLNPPLGNYRLHPASPAIDAGTLTGAPKTDILGKQRAIDGNGDCVALPDMGAYEFGTPGAGC
jgi:predicted outer membrane repeat protein